MANPHIGSSFEDFLSEEGIDEEVRAAAVKQVLAWQIDQCRQAQGLSKSALAKRMQTSRTQVERLLDPIKTRGRNGRRRRPLRPFLRRAALPARR